MRRDPGYSFKSPYKLESGKETSTWLYLQHGTSTKYMPITLVSNSKFEEVTSLFEQQPWKACSPAPTNGRKHAHHSMALSFMACSH